MRNNAPKKNTNRVEKVNSLMEHLLGPIILPYTQSLGGITTIKKVQASRDLRWAKVWITIVNGNDGTIRKTRKDNIHDIQGELYQQMEMKIIPRISFHLDTTARYAQHIDEIFKQIHEEQGDTRGNDDAE